MLIFLDGSCRSSWKRYGIFLCICLLSAVGQRRSIYIWYQSFTSSLHHRSLIPVPLWEWAANVPHARHHHPCLLPMWPSSSSRHHHFTCSHGIRIFSTGLDEGCGGDQGHSDSQENLIKVNENQEAKLLVIVPSYLHDVDVGWVIGGRCRYVAAGAVDDWSIWAENSSFIGNETAVKIGSKNEWLEIKIEMHKKIRNAPKASGCV